jgi:predicted Fe-S protein YdhL (DUF1289 family)
MNATTKPGSAVASPCTSVCAIDASTGLCAGCARTIDEIARWGSMSDEEKRAVLRALPARAALHDGRR